MSLAPAPPLSAAEYQGHDRAETEQEIDHPLGDAVAYLEAAFDTIGKSIEAARAGEATYDDWQVLRDNVTRMVFPASKPALTHRRPPALLMTFVGTCDRPGPRLGRRRHRREGHADAR